VTSRSPQQPSDLVVEVAAASPDEVGRRTQAARRSAAQWTRGAAGERAAALDAGAALLERMADELTALIVREVGKPLAESRGEVGRSVAILRYYAQQVYDPIGDLHAPSGRGLLFSERRPHGVAGLITPWNFPLAIPLWKAAPALAFGNAVVLKPAPQATAVALRLAELLDDVLPADLFAVVPGDAETGRAVIEHSDCVSFTGSAGVGAQVAAAAVARGLPVQAEMGGQNASIVLPDIDPAAAAAQVTNGAFSYSGQKCTATRRVIVVGDQPAFVEALVESARALPVGDPKDGATVIGPVIDEFAQGNVLNAGAEATRAGGRVLCGGGAPYDDAWYVAPTLVDGLARDHRLCQEEVFGPLCTVLSAPDEATALALANDVRYGLVTGIYTSDLDRALRLVDGVETGLVKVNAPTSGVDFYLPFGGVKASSYGAREQGKAARDFYTFTRTVTLAPSA
jgi:aldehyde dehydrogenase (NAD+)